MEYKGIEIPNDKIIEAAKELGYVKMPTEEWFIGKIEAVSPDYVGERYALPIARYLHEELIKIEQGGRYRRSASA